MLPLGTLPSLTTSPSLPHLPLGLQRKWRFAQAYLQSLEGEEGMGDCRSLKAHLVRCLIKADDFGSAMMLRAQLGRGPSRTQTTVASGLDI